MTARTWPAMYEIRLRQSDGLPKEKAASSSRLWICDTPQNREKLTRAVEVGNRLYGEQTHWNGSRQA